jgi:hypothetical protein
LLRHEGPGEAGEGGWWCFEAALLLGARARAKQRAAWAGLDGDRGVGAW